MKNKEIFFKQLAFTIRLRQLKSNYGSATLWLNSNVNEEIIKCEKWIKHLSKQLICK